ncbi:MAG: Stp1/IreP family PP2C-type Ser/Thr phosphatase [Fimbriimonadaceae bacterium]
MNNEPQTIEDPTAPYETAELVQPEELRVRPHFTVAAKTHLGRIRENNEDKFEFYLAELDDEVVSKGSIFVVCDGMGGHAAGQIASELASNLFIENYLKHPSADSRVAARTALEAANRFVYDGAQTIPARRGMGTTFSALIVLQNQSITVQVGDSRVYRIRDGILQMLTKDHSYVEELIRNGMDRTEAENSPYKHVLTRAIGTEADVEVDVDHWEVRVGDQYLLCSDGLTNHVTDEQILDTLQGNPPSKACNRLVDMALADGGSDNCTVMIVRIDELEEVESTDPDAQPSD